MVPFWGSFLIGLIIPIITPEEILDFFSELTLLLSIYDLDGRESSKPKYVYVIITDLFCSIQKNIALSKCRYVVTSGLSSNPCNSLFNFIYSFGLFVMFLLLYLVPKMVCLLYILMLILSFGILQDLLGRVIFPYFRGSSSVSIVWSCTGFSFV